MAVALRKSRCRRLLPSPMPTTSHISGVNHLSSPSPASLISRRHSSRLSPSALLLRHSLCFEKGFPIGNGLTNPVIQYPAYPDYALEMGLILQAEHDRLEKIVPLCELSIKLCGTDGTTSCLASYLVCNTLFTGVMKHAGGVNHTSGRSAKEFVLLLKHGEILEYAIGEKVAWCWGHRVCLL